MNHEKLIYYQVLMEVAKTLEHEFQRWPKGYGYLVDQGKRAISWAVLNLCEGNGKRSFKERRRFFQISLGSIAEVAGLVDLSVLFSLISRETQEFLKSKLRASYAMIRNL